MVHESEGPVAGSVSQNWVCRRAPPGWLKQQLLATVVVLWQLSGRDGGQVGRPARTGAAARCWSFMMVKCRRERVEDCVTMEVEWTMGNNRGMSFFYGWGRVTRRVEFSSSPITKRMSDGASDASTVVSSLCSRRGEELESLRSASAIQLID